MTGFARANAANEQIELGAEIRSVNHRFLDLGFRLPQIYSCFEHRLAKSIKERLRRGRVEFSVVRKDSGEGSFEVKFNKELYQAYLLGIEQASAVTPLDEGTLANIKGNLLMRRDVLEVSAEEADVESEWNLVSGLLSDALDKLLAMREEEGERLKEDLEENLRGIEKSTKKVSGLVSRGLDGYREKLQDKIQKLLADIEIDAARLAQEVAFLAERSDINEEIVRLESHFSQFRKVLKAGEGGRKLEFLLQEMNREINTIGSKAQSAEVTNIVVECKSFLEKMREQVQNIE